MRFVRFVLAILLFVCLCTPVFAQKFGADMDETVTTDQNSQGLGDILKQGWSQYKAATQQANAIKEQQNYQQKLQEIKRGRKIIERKRSPNEPPSQADEMILAFYEDFKIYKDSIGKVRCDVNFVLISTLNQMLHEINFQLVWPNKTVGLTYEKVEPQTPYVYEYTLSGEGCYSMYNAPDVVINKCRAVGLSKKDCANRVLWLSAAQ